ncbi:unnamed protein product [Notodromas monacha]|uniref:ribonuclease H n=1 Tax=Notodromas monacha TaxID=399045 RepID=A0A7R9BWU4_9CRUS|nr:unnamed protein product [Notodromas monacha]CAG0922122.1 unnamed protein product [Notodromas monacha]
MVMIPQRVMDGAQRAYLASSRFYHTDDGYAYCYADGSCMEPVRNAGVGVWFGQDHLANVSEPLEVPGTNNRAELLALLYAIHAASGSGVQMIEIRSDSQYAINCVTIWLPNWKRNGWRTQSNHVVENQAEIRAIDDVRIDLQHSMHVRWKWVPGHSGDPGNDAADRLAKAGAAQSLANYQDMQRYVSSPVLCGTKGESFTFAALKLRKASCRFAYFVFTRILNRGILKKRVHDGAQRAHLALSRFLYMDDGYAYCYAGGSCMEPVKNAGVGVWFGHDHPANVSEPLEVPGTINRAELLALLYAIHAAHGCGLQMIEIRSESKCAINCVTEWLTFWKQHGWRTASKYAIENQAEIRAIDEAHSLLHVRYNWVPRHSGDAGNHAADRWAKAGAAQSLSNYLLHNPRH